MRAEAAFSQSPETDSGGVSSQAGGGTTGDGGGSAPSGGGTNSPVYADDTKQKSLTDLYTGYLATIGTGAEGTVNEPTLQPLAPQAPGNVLYGRFQSAMTGKAKWVIIALVVIGVIWWWNKRKSA